MRWQIAVMAGALALGACETHEAIDPIDVTTADLAGDYDVVTIGGVQPSQLDEYYCLDSGLSMFADGSFVIQHAFTERVGVGTSQACSTDPGADVFDIFWHGTFENTSTLVVMTIEESEFAWQGTSEFTDENTELVGEFNPETGRLAVRFPDVWSFNPHGGSDGKISIGAETRGLGTGTLVFQR